MPRVYYTRPRVSGTPGRFVHRAASVPLTYHTLEHQGWAPRPLEEVGMTYEELAAEEVLALPERELLELLNIVAPTQLMLALNLAVIETGTEAYIDNTAE